MTHFHRIGSADLNGDKTMKRVFIIIVLCVLLMVGLSAAISCGTSSQTISTTPGTDTQVKPPPGETAGPDFKPAAVEIKDFAFSPATLEVAVGTTVTWTNKDSVSHTIVSQTNIFQSGTMSEGDTFSYTFKDKGSFDYHCGIHPSMKGTVTVK
jgi:plastocyanin